MAIACNGPGPVVATRVHWRPSYSQVSPSAFPGPVDPPNTTKRLRLVSYAALFRRGTVAPL